MKAEEAKLGQYVQIMVTGKIVAMNYDLVKIEVDHPNEHWKTWTTPVPWTAVEPMGEAELRELDDPTIINGA